MAAAIATDLRPCGQKKVKESLARRSNHQRVASNISLDCATRRFSINQADA